MPKPHQITKEFEIETELLLIKSHFRGFISKESAIRYISPILRM